MALFGRGRCNLLSLFASKWQGNLGMYIPRCRIVSLSD